MYNNEVLETLVTYIERDPPRIILSTCGGHPGIVEHVVTQLRVLHVYKSSDYDCTTLNASGMATWLTWLAFRPQANTLTSHYDCCVISWIS